MEGLNDYGKSLVEMLDTYSEVIQKKNISGIDVYQSQEDGTTLSKIYIQFYHGSFADSIPGIHHVLEHMIFKGKNAELVKRMESLGASLNAFTSVGHTVFTMECSTKKTFEIMPIFVDMFKTGENGFDIIESEWELEKSVIQSERVQAENDHDCNVGDAVAASMYADGVQLNVLGSENDINSITIDDLKRTYSEMVYKENVAILMKHGVYCNNMAIRMASLLAERIPSFPDRDRIGDNIFAPRDRATDYTIGVKNKNADCIDFNMYARFDLNPLDPLHDVLMGLMSAYISGGISSPLFTKVRDGLGDVYTCGAYTYTGMVIGANLGICAGIHAEDPSKHFRACQDILVDLKENGMTIDGFEMAKNRLYYRIAKNCENGRFEALRHAANYRADKVYVSMHSNTILENMSYGIANGFIKEILNDRLLSINTTIVYPDKGDEANA